MFDLFSADLSPPSLPSADFKIDSPEFQAKLNTPGFCEKFNLPSEGTGLSMESPEIKAMLERPDFHTEMGWPSPSAPSGSWFELPSFGFGSSSPAVEVPTPSVNMDTPKLDISAGGGMNLPSAGNNIMLYF